MAQTLVKNLLHIIFSTKNRDPMIAPEIERDLHAYMTGIVKNYDAKLLAINGTADHVHLLVSLSKNHALAKLMEDLKGDSSKWIKKQGSPFQGFYWQEGYGAFSIGESMAATVKRYIGDQKKHHRRMTFQEELIRFLEKYEIDYDERYIWR